MDGKKAIQILKWHRPVGAINAGFPVEPNEDMEAFNLAIKALEKQIPKKPIEHTKLPNNRFSYLCSNCNRLYWDREFLGDYCSSCGQKFDLD